MTDQREGTANLSSARPPQFSDDALALRFAERYGDELRYVAKWSQWLRWDGRRWRFDDTLAAFDRARLICRAAAAECNEAKPAKEIASAKTVAAVERMARSDRRLAATVEQWDADLWLVNTQDGVIDLRTGKMRKHRADDYITRMPPSRLLAPVHYGTRSSIESPAATRRFRNICNVSAAMR